jgi:hypothetical protein
MPVSSEFIEICDAQVDVLANGLGASLCIVYLTEPTAERGSGALVPVVVYPEDLNAWAQSELLRWLGYVDGLGYPAIPLPGLTQHDPSSNEPVPNRLQSMQFDMEIQPSDDPSEVVGDGRSEPGLKAIAPLLSGAPQPEQHKIALPLVYDGIVVGLLVTARPDRIWTDQEHHQIEQIAKTISIACVMDQRSQWLEARLQHPHQTLLQAHQHDVFDDLIHQFRNPLTALRTFGKLLMRRLQPGDRNFGVAESIVRESDRLQDLLQQFKTALDLESVEHQDWTWGETRRLVSRTRSVGSRTLDQATDQLTDQATNSGDEPFMPNALPSAHGTPPVIDVASSATYLTGHDISSVPCELSEVVTPVLDVAEAIAHDQEVTLDVAIEPSLPLVLADAKGLQEVLMNLIDNAIKYTPAGGHVLLHAQSYPSNQQPVIVADTGLGIPLEDREHLFERHFRGVQADGNIPGTGLGLAIARDLITQMGGRIEVFSPVTTAPLLMGWPPSPSNYPGTSFIIWLHKAPASATA